MFDIFNFAVILSFGFIGFYRGFIKEMAGLVIFALAAMMALHFAIPIDFMLSKSIPFPLFSTVLSHVIVFSTVLFTSKLFFLKTIIQSVRFLSTGADSLLGMVFGMIKGLLCSLLIFSCLYISGVAHSFSLEKTWFYNINHKLYGKLAVFVTEGEIISLAKTKHVAPPIDNIDLQNTENDPLKQTEVTTPNSTRSNLDRIISIIYEKGSKFLDDQDYQVISDVAANLSELKLHEIFEKCCSNIEETQERLHFSTDQMILYIASTVFDSYKSNNTLSEEQKLVMQKISAVLADASFENKKKNQATKNVEQKDKNKKHNVEQNHTKNEAKNKNKNTKETKQENHKDLNSKNQKSPANHKQTKIPMPKVKAEPAKTQNYKHSLDITEDLNKLIEESID